MLVDNHGRNINYLRLAVTDRCNLRCFYCMPAEGLDWLSRNELMTDGEMLRLCTILVKMGVEKIRITGGEPFVRKNIMQLLASISNLPGLDELTITTNGVLTAQYVPELKKIGVRSVNLSLDTLDANRFFAITKRDEFANVIKSLEQLLKHDIKVKINAVVMEGKNTQDIIPLVQLTKELPVSVRFIEEMPFNGDGHIYTGLQWDYVRILDEIKQKYPDIDKLTDPVYSTSYNYQVPNHQGTVGIIAAYSRTFCGTCNRIRITPDGELRTCLYGDGVLNVKELLRSNAASNDLLNALMNAFSNRPRDGWEAQHGRGTNSPAHESMATIGG